MRMKTKMAPRKLHCICFLITLWLTLALARHDAKAATKGETTVAERKYGQTITALDNGGTSVMSEKIVRRKLSDMSRTEDEHTKDCFYTGKKGLKVMKCKQYSRFKADPDEEVYEGGSFAFSADYHQPMHHPPKHN